MIRVDVVLQVLQAFKLHPALWTPQPSRGLLRLRVPGRDGSSLAGTLAVRAPDVI